MCGPLGNLSSLLDWRAVSAAVPAAQFLSNSQAIDSGIRLRLHASHPNSIYYAGYSSPEHPAFAVFIENLRELLHTKKSSPHHCWLTFTHFKELGLVAAVVVQQTDEKVISCCTWAYKGISATTAEVRLREFVGLSLCQILEKNNPPPIAFSRETKGWRCNISNKKTTTLSAAYVQCSDCIVTCSTSIVRWFWQRKENIRPCYAPLYLEISYALLAQMAMADGKREYNVSMLDS
jgi:hypothetical protein